MVFIADAVVETLALFIASLRANARGAHADGAMLGEVVQRRRKCMRGCAQGVMRAKASLLRISTDA